jgi:hypothetical protein
MAETIIDGKTHRVLMIDSNVYGDYGIFSVDESGRGTMLIALSVTEIVDLRTSIDEFLIGLRDNLSQVVGK